MLTLYMSPDACSLAAHIALEEAGAAFEIRPLSLRRGDQKRPGYLKIHRHGKVPALVVDGRPIIENVAILSWIAERYPEAGLLPAGGLARIEALSFLSWLASVVHPSFNPLLGPQYFAETEEARREIGGKARAMVMHNLHQADGLLEGRPYALGDFSLVDAHLFVFFNWAMLLKLDTTALPNYAAHFERMKARPAVQRVLACEAEARRQLDAAA